jgi:hypothetical protein
MPTWSLVPLGLVAGHVAAYGLVAHPYAADRRVALAGHDYFSLLVQLTLLAALTPLVRAVMLARKGEQLPVNSMCVAWLQVGAFTALEVVERLAAAGTAVGLLHEPAVWSAWSLRWQWPECCVWGCAGFLVLRPCGCDRRRVRWRRPPSAFSRRAA